MPQYQTPPTKSAIIVPVYLSPPAKNDFGKVQFGVKIEDRDGNELWFNSTKTELFDQFKVGKQTAIEWYRTEKGYYKIAQAEAVGWEPQAGEFDPRVNPPEDMLAAPAQSKNGKKDFRSRGELIRADALLAAADVLSGSAMAADAVISLASEFVDFIAEPTPEAKLDTLEEKIGAVAEVLGGQVLPDEDNDEDIPF